MLGLHRNLRLQVYYPALDLLDIMRFATSVICAAILAGITSGRLSSLALRNGTDDLRSIN
jgi:hypothetical protein